VNAPKAFPSTAAFRNWLERNGASVAELIVRCFKVHGSDRGLTYKQALDEALCTGWIDGVRRGLDEDSFTVRFTPRKATSVWSAVNVKRARELEAEGRMTANGRAAFEARQSAKGRYSFESEPADFAPAMKKRFRARAKAWAFWAAQPPGYRRVATFWVMSAKKQATRERRLDTVIACSARRERIPLLARPRKGDKGQAV
jgi:uncharacterized protein YdeI (YjbR/CyaY-like superfamily)